MPLDIFETPRDVLVRPEGVGVLGVVFSFSAYSHESQDKDPSFIIILLLVCSPQSGFGVNLRTSMYAQQDGLVDKSN